MNNKTKKVVAIALLLILVICIIIGAGLYIGNKTVRNWFDKNVLRKDIEQSNLPKIALEGYKSTKIFAYSNKVAIFNDNTLTIYNQNGKRITEINVQAEKPIFATSGEYLLIGDEGNSDVYLIYGETLQWQKEIEGQVSQICVNKNGAVGIAISGTVYKSVIVMYDITGKESFRTFLSTTTATDIELSDDGKYLSFIEINTSGAAISSAVKTISVEKAKSNSEDAIIYTYKGENNSLFLKIKYRKDNVVCFADDSIHVYSNGNDEKILDINKNINLIDINNSGYISYIVENTLENVVELHILNIENKKDIIYNLKNAAKNIYCNEGTTAIDLGNEIHFIDANGWLIKKYSTVKNIKEVVVGKKVVAIVYKDSIEVMNL